MTKAELNAHNVRSDNLLGQTFHITPQQLYTVFRPTTWLEKQGKSKWTDKDEHHLRMCLECVEECAFQDREDFSKTTDWLKSLKQRMEE